MYQKFINSQKLFPLVKNRLMGVATKKEMKRLYNQYLSTNYNLFFSSCYKEFRSMGVTKDLIGQLILEIGL